MWFLHLYKQAAECCCCGKVHIMRAPLILSSPLVFVFFFSIFLRTAVLSRQYTLEVLYFMSISSLPEDHLACEFMIKIETIRSKLSWHHTPPTSLFISILLLTLFSYASKRKCSDSFKWIPTFCLGSLPYPFLLCSFKLCSIIYLLSQLFSLSHFRNDHDFSVFIK